MAHGRGRVQERVRITSKGDTALVYIVSKDTCVEGQKSRGQQATRVLALSRLRLAQPPSSSCAIPRLLDPPARRASPRRGELFAVCPVPPGKKAAHVLSAVDSCRNFLVRVEDAESGRHAFVGLSFSDRGDAFDFSVALVRHCPVTSCCSTPPPPLTPDSPQSDHERQVTAGRSGEVSASQAIAAAADAKDWSLAEGQTIRCAGTG